MNKETKIDVNLEKNMQEEKPVKGLDDNKQSPTNNQSQTGDAARKLGDVDLETVAGGVTFYCNDQAPGILENDNIDFDNVSFQNPWRDK
ncbi:MAG: hypothetical protein IJL09_08575 [Lachnospiraceae bacterium]|nr:hypothetical protein [Lachnospiraceae bacterium]